MGGSRGGSPTYLAKIRDEYSLEANSQIDRAIVVIGSVTDFLLPEIAEACANYIEYDGYVCEPDPQYPEIENGGFTYHYFLEDYNVFARLLEPYLKGEIDGETEEEVFRNARKRLVGASPKYFAAEYLFNVQVHHGTIDEACRVDQTYELWGVLDKVQDHIEYRFYEGVDHQIELLDESDYGQTYQYATQLWFGKIMNGN